MMQGTALQTSPHAPLQGAATWQIKGHVSRATACLFGKFHDDSWTVALVWQGDKQSYRVRNTVTNTDDKKQHHARCCWGEVERYQSSIQHSDRNWKQSTEC